MKEFKDMKFYSTADLAEKLNMNIQVITRKLQAKEIEGYKIGKDWRVEEDAVQRWLDKISNRHPVLTPREKVLSNFIRDGRLTQIPAQRKKRVYVLEHILTLFNANRSYSEAEVNEIIQSLHDDFCTLRREMIMEKMMFRKDGIYRRNGNYKFSDA